MNVLMMFNDEVKMDRRAIRTYTGGEYTYYGRRDTKDAHSLVKLGIGGYRGEEGISSYDHFGNRNSREWQTGTLFAMDAFVLEVDELTAGEIRIAGDQFFDEEDYYLGYVRHEGGIDFTKERLAECIELSKEKDALKSAHRTLNWTASVISDYVKELSSECIERYGEPAQDHGRDVADRLNAVDPDLRRYTNFIECQERIINWQYLRERLALAEYWEERTSLNSNGKCNWGTIVDRIGDPTEKWRNAIEETETEIEGLLKSFDKAWLDGYTSDDSLQQKHVARINAYLES